MKKIFLSLTLLIILIIGSVYGLLFTKYGNSIVSSYIEKKVNSDQKELKLKVNTFILNLKGINFNASINDNSNIDISGDFSILKKSVDLKYDIKINEISTLKSLIGQELKGSFFTNGIFKGNSIEAIIQGFSSLANSETKYYVNLVDFKAKNVNFEVKDANIEELLSFFNKPAYAKGNLNINANINNIQINNLDGVFKASISKGVLNNEILNKEFNQTIQSSINFQGDVNASLLGNKIEAKSELITSIADIFIDKTLIDLEKNILFSDYKIEVKNLNKLQGIVSKKLNGEFSTNGNISYENNIYKINGNSNIWESWTSYNFNLDKLEVRDLNFDIKNAKVEKLLHMLNEPVYLTGNLDVIGNILSTNRNNLNGSISSKITDAKLINEVVNAVFNQELKDTITFDLITDSSLLSNQAISKVNLSTNIGNINSEKVVFDFKENSFKSDYLLTIPSLILLKDFTKTKLRGKIDVKGEILSKENLFELFGKSNILGGNLDFNIKNDDLKAKLNGVSIKELSYMMHNPEIFDSVGDFSLDYNLLVKKGEIKGSLLNGHFIQNDFSSLVNNLAKFDLTREVYETVDINSNINQNQLLSTVNMKSKNTKIDIIDSILDFEQNTIDAKIDTQIKKSSFSILVKGDISNPKISLATKELLKNEVNKAVDKNKNKIEEKLNKVLDGKMEDEKAKELIKNLKSIF